MPADVQDVFGHAFDLAQSDAKHPDAKPLKVLEVLESSGNVYEDLGTPNANEMRVKSQLAAKLAR